MTARIDDGVDEDGAPAGDSGVYYVDIPPHVYERGGGYNWRKIEGVEFRPGHVVIERLSPDPNDADF